MGGEPARILLHEVKHECRARWRRTTRPPKESRNQYVKVGVLLDTDRWYVDVIKPDLDDCRPVADEQSAREVAQAWMRRLGGDWEQVPCYPTEGWLDGERG